ncbi:MAG: hypothetical protein ABI016_15815 [Chthoniobacterales bacterium]
MNAKLRWKLIAGFVLVFLAGAAAGGFFASSQAWRHRPDYSHHRHSLAERMRSRIEAQLDLTPAQLEQAAPIFERTAQELEKIRAETGDRVRQVMDKADRALAPELTEAQRIKLETLKKPGRGGREGHKGPRRHAEPPPP